MSNDHSLQTMPTSHLAFPAEIWDNIFSFHERDKGTMRSLSLACRAFTPLCQRYFFHEITLSPPIGSKALGTEDSCSRFYQIIRRSPRLALHVQVLNIRDGYHDRSMQAALVTKCSVKWVAASPVLPTILNVLKNLTSLSITHEGYRSLDRGRLSWNDLSNSLRDSLKVACQSLTSLSLRNVVGFSRPLLDNTPYLKALDIQDNCITDRTAHSARDLGLSALRIISNSTALRWIMHVQSRISLSSIKRLTVSRPNSYSQRRLIPYEDLQELFKICHSTLEYLECSIYHLYRTKEQTRYLGSFPRLLQVKLYMTLTDDMEWPSHMNIIFGLILGGTTVMSTLEELTLEIEFMFPPDRISKDDWDIMDFHLAGPSFPFLRTVFLRTKVASTFYGSRSVSVSFFRPCLPSFQKKGSLHVTIERLSTQLRGCPQCR